jgi:hypothetical protein
MLSPWLESPLKKRQVGLPREMSLTSDDKGRFLNVESKAGVPVTVKAGRLT